MYYVYLLKDLDNKLYIGYTKSLKRRLNEHKLKKVYTTKRMNKPEIFYYGAYCNENLAKERERKLKQYGSSYKGLIKRISLNK